MSGSERRAATCAISSPSVITPVARENTVRLAMTVSWVKDTLPRRLSREQGEILDNLAYRVPLPEGSQALEDLSAGESGLLNGEELAVGFAGELEVGHGVSLARRLQGPCWTAEGSVSGSEQPRLPSKRSHLFSKRPTEGEELAIQGFQHVL